MHHILADAWGGTGIPGGGEGQGAHVLEVIQPEPRLMRKRAYQPVHAKPAQSVLQPKRIAVFPVKREWKAYQGLHILKGNNK